MTCRQPHRPDHTPQWLVPLVLGVLAGSGLLAAAWFGTSLGASARSSGVEPRISPAVLVVLVPAPTVAAGEDGLRNCVRSGPPGSATHPLEPGESKPARRALWRTRAVEQHHGGRP